jgi:hypothetical protein
MPHQKAAWQYQKQGLVFKNVGSVEAHSFTPTYATQIEVVNARLPKQ